MLMCSQCMLSNQAFGNALSLEPGSNFDAKVVHDRFLELTQAKETLPAWAGEFKAVKESWPHGKPHCFCDNCRRLIQQMLNCPKCLALKTNSGHDCGVFAKAQRQHPALSDPRGRRQFRGEGD